MFRYFECCCGKKLKIEHSYRSKYCMNRWLRVSIKKAKNACTVSKFRGN